MATRRPRRHPPHSRICVINNNTLPYIRQYIWKCDGGYYTVVFGANGRVRMRGIAAKWFHFTVSRSIHDGIVHKKGSTQTRIYWATHIMCFYATSVTCVFNRIPSGLACSRTCPLTTMKHITHAQCNTENRHVSCSAGCFNTFYKTGQNNPKHSHWSDNLHCTTFKAKPDFNIHSSQYTVYGMWAWWASFVARRPARSCKQNKTQPVLWEHVSTQTQHIILYSISIWWTWNGTIECQSMLCGFFWFLWVAKQKQRGKWRIWELLMRACNFMFARFRMDSLSRRRLRTR